MYKRYLKVKERIAQNKFLKVLVTIGFGCVLYAIGYALYAVVSTLYVAGKQWLF